MVLGRTIVSAVLLFLSVSGVAWAKPQSDLGAEAVAARQISFEGLAPSAGFTAVPSFDEDWSVVTFYVRYDRAADKLPHWWVARRVVAGPKSERRVEWTDSRRCPALKDALGRMAWIAPASVRPPAMTPYEPVRSFTADGVTYILWSTNGAQPDGSPFEISVSSNGGAIAAWGEQTLRSLALCWRDTAPQP